MRIGGFQATNTAIQNPFTFYYVSNNDWSSTHNYDYWNKNFTSAASVDNTITTKTIYDPSVSGFALPRTAAFTGFTSSGYNTTNGGEFNVSGSFNKGWNFYTNGWRTGSTVFFHALGFRDIFSGRSSGTGAVAYVGGGGTFWASGASSASIGLHLNFSSDFVFPQGADGRSYGLPVRPVKE